MQRVRVLAVVLLALMLLSAIPAQRATASSGYSEKLNVYMAGSDAYWYFTFGGINGTARLASFEESPGLSWYNVTAIKTSGWLPDFQVFGPAGYNLLPVPLTSSQGLFLTVGSDTYTHALAAASKLNAYFLSAFVSLSNGTSSFEFYSPITYSQIIPSTLLGLVPASMGGFASAFSATSFDNTLSPFVTLAGTSGASGFSHTLVVGSISKTALDSSDRPKFLSYFGKNITTLVASKESSSSTISFKVLDGVIVPKGSTVGGGGAQPGNTYSVALSPSENITTINEVVLQSPPQLLAVRNVDVGVLREDQNMTVTMTLTNLSNSTALDGVTLSDNWWNPSQFKLVRGSATFSASALNASQTDTPFYTLEYIGNATGRVGIPATIVRFTYEVSGTTFQGHSMLNPIAISLNQDDAVVYSYVTPKGSSSLPVGDSQELTFVVKNVGTRAASSVVVDGKSIGGLAAEGGTATVTLPQASRGVLGTNITESYPVTYLGVQSSELSTSTNQVQFDFSHTKMMLAFVTVVVGANLAPVKAGLPTINLTLTFTVSNSGPANASHFIAQLTLPSTLGCGKPTGKAITCASNTVTLNYTTLAKSSVQKSLLKYNVTSFRNYIIAPASYHGMTSGISFSGWSNSVAAPTGFVLTKQFNPSLLFGGSVSSVTLTAVNEGPFYLYNATVSSTKDSFDTLTSSAVTSIGNATVSLGKNLTRTYTVKAGTLYGTHAASAISASAFFGGTKFSLENLGGYVSVYQPLNVTVTSSPTVPTEGKSFDLDFTIHNPTSVNVTDILYRLPLPTGLTVSDLTDAVLSNGAITISVASLLAHSTYTATGVATAGSGTTISFSSAQLTFVYAGATVTGSTTTKSLSIAEDVITRYLIPIAIAGIALLATAFYVRRLAVPTVRASPK